MTGLAELTRSERLDHIEFLGTLTPGEWATPSLCSEWTVQDVAAHVAWAPAARPLETLRQVVRGGFNVNQANARAAREWACRGREAIMDQLRITADKGLRPPGTPESAALADAVVHALDIRKPLGKTKALNPESFAVVADSFATLRWPLTITIGGNARQRIRGLRLVATDLEWSHGNGPEVHAPAEALLLVLTGRPVSTEDFTGPGAKTLMARG